MPNDFPPWPAVYQQTQRWLQAQCFEAMVNDLRSLLRVAQGKQGQPSVAIMDGRTSQSTWKVVHAPAMTDTSERRAARSTWRWIRWAIYWRCE
jgi:hypothetical protein